MFLDELSNVVHDACHAYNRAAVPCLVDILIPVHFRQLVKRNAPIELRALLIKLLLLLLNTSLIDFVLTELLQVIGEPELFASPDKPFSGIVLVPFDCVAIVRRKLMMKVVVTLTKSDKSGDDMVPRAVLIIKRLVAQPMSPLTVLDSKKTSLGGTG